MLRDTSYIELTNRYTLYNRILHRDWVIKHSFTILKRNRNDSLLVKIHFLSPTDLLMEAFNTGKKNWRTLSICRIGYKLLL
ncbi:hypothetical protein HZS_5995 [Henneguya salminicola]|nr:hypothetical protein HZS_5995 [Henneguya salminicola]